MTFKILSALTIGTSCLLNCSSPDEKLESLIAAERQFSRQSEELGMRSAFLESFSPDVVYFDSARNQVDYRDHLKTQPPPKADARLVWEPYFADIAGSGDFGFTTGPFYYYANQSDSVPAMYGYYHSVWSVDAEGTWKVVMDLGGPIPGKPQENPGVRLSTLRLSNNEDPVNLAEERTKLKTVEQEYVEKLNASKHSFDSSMLSEEIRAFRPGRYPFIGKVSVVDIPEADKTFAFTPMDIRLARSADMGLTYGKVDILVKRESGEQEIKAVYYRVWKKESDGQWKLILDVIGLT